MTKWIGKDIVKLLEGPELEVSFQNNPGGDWDTCPIIVKIIGKEYPSLFIRGFVTTDAPISQSDDVDVEMVELTDGLVSNGGLNSNDPEVILLYSCIRVLLVEKDFNIVNSMSDYF